MIKHFEIRGIFARLSDVRTRAKEEIVGNFKLRWRTIGQATLFSTAAFLVCGTALAQNPPVNGFVIINPISVCSSGLCAPYGVSCTSTSGKPVCTKSPAPSSATTNTPIGFVDADTNVNLTRAFWAQAGIDVAFFPIQSYNSPSNVIPSSWNNIKDAAPTGSTTTFTYAQTTYQNLHLVSVLCSDGFIALTSPDFEALTQHPVCTEHGGLGSSYSKLANPPPAPSPAPPLAVNGCSTGVPCSPLSNAIDVFFVNNYSGTGVSSPQFGFSWINGDGVSVGQSIFSLIQPRYDTLAHEIGHALALTHQNFGANNDPTPTSVLNMMLLGSTRATSYNSGCQQFMGNFSTNPPILNNGALFDLDYMTSTFNPCGGQGSLMADHLTLQPIDPATGLPKACTSPLDPTTCLSQEGAAALSPFINKILPNTANAGGGAAFASTMTTGTTSSSGTPAPVIITISVGDAPNDGSIPDLASSIIALPPNDPLSFSGNHPVTQIGGTAAANATGPCDANHLNNCAVQVTSVTKLSNQQVTGNPGCDSGTGQPPSSQCVRVVYSTAATNAGFGPDNPAFNPNTNPPLNVVLAVDFNKDAGSISANNLLAGSQYTAIYSNGFATTSLFGTAVAGVFTANSEIPDLTTPNVLLDPSHFNNASAVKFTNMGHPKLAQCTPPYATVFVKIKGQLVPETVCPDGNLPDGPD